jgi:hypothetical protein
MKLTGTWLKCNPNRRKKYVILPVTQAAENFQLTLRLTQIQREYENRINA